MPRRRHGHPPRLPLLAQPAVTRCHPEPAKRVKDLSSISEAPSRIPSSAPFLVARLHQCLYQCSAAFISGAVDLSLPAIQPSAFASTRRRPPAHLGVRRLAAAFPCARLASRALATGFQSSLSVFICVHLRSSVVPFSRLSPASGNLFASAAKLFPASRV
jgi:hypothetical protein